MAADPRSVAAGDDGESRHSQRMLLFRLERRAYALPLSSVEGLGEIGEVRRVPGAPRGVLGLTEWRGRLLSVLDLPRLLDDAPQEGRPCLVRLAAPLTHCALYVPSSVQLERVESADRDEPHAWGDPGPRLEHEGRPLHVIDPERLLARLGDAPGA